MGSKNVTSMLLYRTDAAARYSSFLQLFLTPLLRPGIEINSEFHNTWTFEGGHTDWATQPRLQYIFILICVLEDCSSLNNLSSGLYVSVLGTDGYKGHFQLGIYLVLQNLRISTKLTKKPKSDSKVLRKCNFLFLKFRSRLNQTLKRSFNS